MAYLVSCKHEDVNQRHRKKLSTPLHHAAQYGWVPYLLFVYFNENFSYCDIMRFLIHYGANVNLKDAEGFTPMHWAADEGMV